MENGQNIFSIICEHILIPCRSSVRAPFVRSLFLFFDDTILMLGAYLTECDILIFSIYSFNETIFGKPAIVGVLLQDGPTSLIHGFLHC